MKMFENEYLSVYLKLLANINDFFAGKTKLVIEVEENKHQTYYPKTTTKIYLEEKE